MTPNAGLIASGAGGQRALLAIRTRRHGSNFGDNSRFDHVSRAALPAHADSVGVVEPYAAAAHPANPTRGDSDHKRVIRHVMRDHSTGAYERISPDRDPADNRRVRTERCSALNERALIFRTPVYVAPGSDHIGEDHRWSAEHVVFQLDAAVERYIVLNFYIVADHDAARDVNVLAEDALAADPAVVHYVREVPDLGFVADFARFVDDCAGMREELARAVCFA